MLATIPIVEVNFEGDLAKVFHMEHLSPRYQYTREAYYGIDIKENRPSTVGSMSFGSFLG